jgi:phosphohistidine phosphatase
MPIYFVQHGLALPKDTDPNRPLSEEGRREAETISAYLQKAGVTVKKTCHSGKLRAKETAQIFAGKIGDGNILELQGMGPNDDVAEFVTRLESDVMYVGHLPHMEKAVSYLVAGDETAGVVKFVNSGVVCVEKDDNGYHIRWYLIPSVCVV